MRNLETLDRASGSPTAELHVGGVNARKCNFHPNLAGPNIWALDATHAENISSNAGFLVDRRQHLI